MNGATAEFVFGVVVGGFLIGLVGFTYILYLISNPWERHHDSARD